MYGRRSHSQAQLPSSHFFVSVARGERMRTFALRPIAVWGAIASLPLALVWGAAVTAYVAFHDDILGALLAREAQMQTAYEQRLSEARAEIDRVASRQLLDQTSFEGRMHDLLSRQARLEQHDHMVAALASQLGPTAKPTGASALGAIGEAVKARLDEAAPADARAYAPAPAVQKPHPIEEPGKGESLSALPQSDSRPARRRNDGRGRGPLAHRWRPARPDRFLARPRRARAGADSLASIETRAHSQASRLSAVVARDRSLGQPADSACGGCRRRRRSLHPRRRRGRRFAVRESGRCARRAKWRSPTACAG